MKTTKQIITKCRQNQKIGGIPEYWVHAENGKILEQSNMDNSKEHEANFPYENDKITNSEIIGIPARVEVIVFGY